MAEQQTAPAPAATADPATSAEPVVATGADKPTPAPQGKPKKGAARHAEIKAKLAAAKPDAPAVPPASADGASAAAAKPEGEKPKPAVGAVMRLTAENTKLKGEIESLQGKLTDASKGETVEALRERVKNDPAVLFDVFGADLDEDENKRLAKLNDAALGRKDPAYAKERERDERVEKLERDLQEARAGEQTRVSQDRDRNAVAHTAKVLTEGHKADDGTVVIDPAKYPYVNHLTKSGEIDAHAGVMYATRDLAATFREKNKREPNDAEIATLIGIAAGEAEAYFSKRAKNWTLPGADPAPAVEEPPARRTPTTIGSGLGSRAPGAVDTKHLSKSERHALIAEKLRRAQAQAAN